MYENNKATVSGTCVSGLQFNHKVYGEAFYIMMVEVARTSGNVDMVPLMISDRLIDVGKDYIGCMIEVSGEYRSFNRIEGEKRRLDLYLFVQKLLLDRDCTALNKNEIFLSGYICKTVIYRQTPLGREIADIMLAVNRQYGRTDYIPCIAWGRCAQFASYLEIGTLISMRGRIQSREYTKKLNETECEKRIAYEISAGWIEVLDEKD